jgi:cytochrome c-type biogenesis protein CcmH/NrfG
MSSPTIKELKETTPENYREVFAKADIDTLRRILNGGTVSANQIILARTLEEMQRRDDAEKKAEKAANRAHNEMLTNRQIIGGVLCIVLGFLLGKYFGH